MSDIVRVYPMCAAVACLAKSDELIQKLIEKMDIGRVMDVLNRLFDAPLTDSALTFENLVSLVLPLSAFEVAIILFSVFGALNWRFR
jgi:hypothetical protein